MGDAPASDAITSATRRAPIPVLGRLIEPVYGAVIARRNAGFDAGRGVDRVAGAAGNIPVISIGNLSVGGTGKTPMVMHVLRVLLEHGYLPCVAMRGYSKSKDGAADETDAYRRAFPDVPIVAQPDRIAGLRSLLERTPAEKQFDRIVLDDGFQHRRIARDLDVVLIDATPGRSVFDDRLLPAGWLREPVGSLARADAVVLTHAELASQEHVDALRAVIREEAAAPVAVTRHVWTGLKHRVQEERPGSENRGTREEMLPLETLVGREIVGCCAIGHPQGFVASLKKVAGGADGGERVGLMVLPDHDPIGAERVRKLVAMARERKAEYIVVTDKDWSKLRHLPDSTWPCAVVRPELAMVFDEGREGFEGLVLGVGNGGRGVGHR